EAHVADRQARKASGARYDRAGCWVGRRGDLNESRKDGARVRHEREEDVHYQWGQGGHLPYLRAHESSGPREEAPRDHRVPRREGNTWPASRPEDRRDRPPWRPAGRAASRG